MQWDEGSESTTDVPSALSGGRSNDETFLPSVPPDRRSKESWKLSFCCVIICSRLVWNAL
jgi:hypothetical protein